ncbi:MAG: holo-ACP synthase [Magnetococcus sp. WYHC-3]
MICGLGSDLVDIARIRRALERFPERFAARVFTPGERAYCAAWADPAACLSKRFAAKEAFVKALGSGFRGGLWFTDIEVVHGPLGNPALRLAPVARAALRRVRCHGPLRVHLTLSDEGGMALAVVVLEGSPPRKQHRRRRTGSMRS